MRSRCSIDGCESYVWGRGLCSLHYTRLRRWGDPRKVLRTMVRGTLAARLETRTEITDSCWLYHGVINRKGYGQISRGTRGEGAILTHRAAWEIANGPIPEGV